MRRWTSVAVLFTCLTDDFQGFASLATVYIFKARQVSRMCAFLFIKRSPVLPPGVMPTSHDKPCQHLPSSDITRGSPMASRHHAWW